MVFSIHCLICIRAQQGGVPKIGIKIKSLPVEFSFSERHVFGMEFFSLELIWDSFDSKLDYIGARQGLPLRIRLSSTAFSEPFILIRFWWDFIPLISDMTISGVAQDAPRTTRTQTRSRTIEFTTCLETLQAYLLSPDTVTWPQSRHGDTSISSTLNHLITNLNLSQAFSK